MYTTAKEVHVYIDLATQNVSSNRRQSISPQAIDLILNNALGEYICSKFPEHSQGKDVESTLKRYTDFSVLKTSVNSTPVLTKTFTKVARVKLPANALKVFDNMAVSYIKPFDESNIQTVRMDILEIRITDSLLNESSSFIDFHYIALNSNGEIGNITKNVHIDLSSVLASIGTKEGMFYVYEYIVDVLRNIYKLNAYYDSSTSTIEERLIRIYFEYDSKITNYSNRSFITYSLISLNQSISKVNDTDKTGYAPLSILSSFELTNALSDHYSKKNLHYNPIGELTSEGIDVYYTDFLPSSVSVNYLKKPKLFDIRTGQIPEIAITKDFLDYAVKEFLMIFNSPMYDRIVNETNKNQ